MSEGTVDLSGLSGIPGLIRCEEYDRDSMGEQLTELTHTVYPHEHVFGEYCTVHAHIECPPERVFEYMANPYSLLEWTYSVRKLRPVGGDGLLVGEDAASTPLYCRTISHREAMTVDYHCAWDQGDELWMIYLNRIIPAEAVLKRTGSVVIWTNCRHPYYRANPFPEREPRGERMWVGELWPLFYAGHTIELRNLKLILEHRYRLGLPAGPILRD
ncbi:MAG TPA: SRPBCC family protein [Vicinamibacterales bacterium]|nr:SRPBCC family protein [Vicinamibacterales bacterium]